MLGPPKFCRLDQSDSTGPLSDLWVTILSTPARTDPAGQPRIDRTRRFATDHIQRPGSMSERAHRFSPRVPRQIDLSKLSQEVGGSLVQWSQPSVFDAPLSAESTDDELAVAADRHRERAGPRTDPLQQVFQGGDYGAELGLIVRHVVPELDLPRGDGPVRSRDLIAAIPLTGVAERPAVEDDRVIGPGNGSCRLQAGVARGRSGRGHLSRPAGKCALEIAHEVDQLLPGECLGVDIQETIGLSIAPVISGQA